MPKMMTLHTVVMRLVQKIAKPSPKMPSIIPCSIKAMPPMPIIRKVGNAMSSVLRVMRCRRSCGFGWFGWLGAHSLKPVLTRQQCRKSKRMSQLGQKSYLKVTLLLSVKLRLWRVERGLSVK